MTTLAERMAAAARELLSEPDEQGTMDAAVHLAVAELSGCDAAGISLVHRSGTIETPAFTDEMVLIGDHLQYDFREGPCIDSIQKESTVHSPELAEDSRWPAWGPAVVKETEARSMLSFQLFTNADTVGALNLYSRSPDGFDEDDREDGLALAAHIAVAVAAAQKIDHSAWSTTRRITIARAEGAIMERYQVSASRAFQLLTQLSREEGTSVSDIAARLMTTPANV